MLLKSVIVLSVVLFDVNCDFLLSSGVYKLKKGGQKKTIYNVASLGPESFPASISYLKINGVLAVLHKGSIHDLADLTELVVPLCNLTEIHAGAFQNVPALTRLNLKSNEIRHIRRGVFNGLNIKILYLHLNFIEIIDKEAFDDMSKLSKIKLNHNRISTWNSDWFKRTPSLSLVSIRRNSIQEIPEEAFKNFKNKQELKLFFSKNAISKIHPGAFKGLKKIGNLFLDRNNITFLNKGMFKGVEKIQHLNLARNKLAAVPEGLFPTGMSVRKFDLSSNNKLVCVPNDVAVKVEQILVVDNIKYLNCTCVSELKTIMRVNATVREGGCKNDTSIWEDCEEDDPC